MSASMASPLIDNLAVVDWADTKRVRLDKVSPAATIGEVLTTAIRAMELPLRSAFQAELRGRQLNRSDTLEELGVRSDDTLRVVPDVSAG